MNRRILAAALVLAGVSLLPACAGPDSRSGNTAAEAELAATGQPFWVTRPPLKNGMAYGVGSMEIYGDQAAALKRAVELARVDLVAQLKVTVSGDFSSTTTETSGSGRDSEVQRSVSNYARSQVAPAELDEIITADTYTDGRYAYALVELDRSQAAARLRRDIADVDQQIEDIAVSPLSGTPLQQLRPLLPAVKLFARRERLAERLQLVSMERRAEPASAALRALQQSIYDRIGQLRVTLQATDEGARELLGGVTEALTEQGLKVQSGGQADLLFTVSAALTRKQQGGNYYVFTHSRVSIADADGRVMSSFSKQAKGVSGLPEVARVKAAQAVAALIADELAATLVDKIH